MFSRTSLVYGLLLAAWGIVVGWQTVEHNRVKASARTALINRARDITTTLGVVIRSQRFRGAVFQERLESALKELVKSGEPQSVALLNAAGSVVALAGAPIDLDAKGVIRTGERWETSSVTMWNLVDLGTNVTPEGETSQPTIVVPRRDAESGPPPEDRPPPPPWTRRPNDATGSDTNSVGTNELAPPRRERGAGPREGDRRRGFGRPGWMDPEQYEALLQKQGLHGCAIVMPTQSFRAACVQDLWLRWIIGAFAGVSVVGLGFAWRNVEKSSELQMRLLRASELNSHLREMNVAAAGLAHETRNPLNIIRGLAQLISRDANASAEVRRKTGEITDEVDRVTAQLNEFINYSKPREIRRAPVTLGSVIADVVRALQSDLEDKAIRLSRLDETLTVAADEQFLRQVLFNLLLNAIQAVDPKGEIQIVARRSGPTEAFFEVRDNGPGVALEQRKEIFKPYFTTHQKGTGLGLAVVQQIVLAHGWEIECVSNDKRGAVFRISRMQLTSKGETKHGFTTVH